MAVRGVRGATRVDRDDAEELLGATAELVTEMLARNRLEVAALVSALFTLTPDLHSAFPASAVRRLGVTDVPLLCATEIDVPGALSRVVRVLLHVETELARADVRHVYLRGTSVLREDLAR